MASGGDLEVIASADAATHLVPDRVEVRYRAEDGARGRPTMSAVGASGDRKRTYQEYSHTFHGVLASTQFDVVGGDDAVRNLRIEVVKSPTLDQMTLDRRFPPYMDLHGTRPPP